MISETIDLWDEDEYFGEDEEYKPTLVTYIRENIIRKAVLVIPGGGYDFVSEREAECVAVAFSNAGYQAFVLNYSVSPNKHPQMLRDAARAMFLIRDNAIDWKVDPNHVAVIGFSAGAHLAASLSVYYNDPIVKDISNFARSKGRPDALILCYPVITAGEKRHCGSFNALCGDDEDAREMMSIEKHISSTMPPTFMWHTFDDSCVPVENTLLLANALRENNIRFELHIYPHGQHGLTLCTAELNNGEGHPHVGSWVPLCMQWLETTL